MTPVNNYVQDDLRKYANKEDAGFLSGATGGFAGGEQGVKMFVDKGNLSLAESDVVAKRQLTKDLISVTTILTLGSLALYFLKEEGVFDATAVAYSIEDMSDVIISTSASTLSTSTDIQPVIRAVQDNYDGILVGLAGAGVVGGTIAVRQGVEQVSNKMLAKVNAALASTKGAAPAVRAKRAT